MPAAALRALGKRDTHHTQRSGSTPKPAAETQLLLARFLRALPWPPRGKAEPACPPRAQTDASHGAAAPLATLTGAGTCRETGRCLGFLRCG